MQGCEWVVEAHGCLPGSLASLDTLRDLFRQIIEDLRLCPVSSPVWHQFPGPGGITGLCLLAESHLACHTFPEHESLCLNLFCCRPRPDWDFDAKLRSLFQARAVSVRRIERPYTDEPANSELPELRRACSVSVV